MHRCTSESPPLPTETAPPRDGSNSSRGDGSARGGGSAKGGAPERDKETGEGGGTHQGKGHGQRQDQPGAARRKHEKKKSQETFSLPLPVGFKVSATDGSTALLEWQIRLPVLPAQCTKEAALLQAIKTELSWREVMQYLKADGEVYHSTGQEWTSGGVLLSGEKVLKKNLLAGHKYEFRVRFVVPQNTSSSYGNDKGDFKGAWSETVSLILPRKPAGTDYIRPGPDNATFAAAHKNGTGSANGLTRNASAYGQKHNAPESSSGHVQFARRAAGEVADSSASLYGRHFGSATSLPEEVEDEADDIVPDQWVEDGSDSDDDDSPAVRRPLRRQEQGGHKHGAAEEQEHGLGVEEEVHTKWYQLMPPDSHVGTGKYKHPVRVARQDEGSVVGYVSTANKVKAKKKTADWMLVQVHWTTAAAALNGDTGGDSASSLPFGWMKRNEWNHRLQREHILLRHIPESYKEMKKFNGQHVSTAIPEEDEADDNHTPLAAKQNQFAHRTHWQESTKKKREQAAKEAEIGAGDDDFFYSNAAAQSFSGNIDTWYEQVDEGGFLYYYNAVTGESRWEPPEWVEEHDSVSGARCVPFT